MSTTFRIPLPDDWHVHLRDDEMLAAVVGYTARRFRYAMVMPNLVPPVTSTSAAAAYRERIMAHAPDDAVDFRPVMALYCSPLVDTDDLRAGIADAVVAAVSSVVAETVQRGYLYLHGDDETMIVRKAEIMIG